MRSIVSCNRSGGCRPCLKGYTMYERSKQMDCFHINGFQYWDGATVVGVMKVGDTLRLCAETDNPHDSDAVALYYGSTKLGYVPADKNELLAQLMYFGHGDIVEARVLQVDTEADPWKQVRVGIFMTDGR